MGEWVKKQAKEEQKKRMEEQVGQVRDKITKWADKVVVSQYSSTKKKYEEGDVWEEGGKTWTIKNGIKQTVRKTQSALMPWWCPKCERPLNHRIHKKFYNIRGACHDCVVQYEQKMILAGVWKAYERREMRKNERAWLKDKMDEIREYVEDPKEPQLHFQDGRWETLAEKGIFTELIEKMAADLNFLNDRLKQIDIDEQEDAEEQQKLLEWEYEHPWEEFK